MVSHPSPLYPGSYCVQYTPRSSPIRIAITTPTPPAYFRMRIPSRVLDFPRGFYVHVPNFPRCIQPTCTAPIHLSVSLNVT